MHVLGCDRTHIYTYPERELTGDESMRYQESLNERARGVPAQYITGHQEFWGLDFLVTPGVLVPRPETEHAVETVLGFAQPQGEWRGNIVDVGTGSGCIAIALAKELPRADISAIDTSADALDVARTNAARLGFLERIRFHQNDLLTGYSAATFDVVVSNPPYVGENEADKVQAEVRKYEPRKAVFGGPEGLDIVRRLIPQAMNALKSGGWLVMEIGYTQSAQVLAMLSDWSDAHAVPDLQGIPRIIAARKP